MTAKEALPFLGEGRSPGGTCGRMLPNRVECGALANWHIGLDDGENGIACDEHVTEARERWSFDWWHAFRWPCTQPGSTRVFDLRDGRRLSWCELEDGVNEDPSVRAGVALPVSR